MQRYGKVKNKDDDGYEYHRSDNTARNVDDQRKTNIEKNALKIDIKSIIVYGSKSWGDT